MAAIEKICEFSEEYPGYDMYRYKHNHIQIMPKYRKEFRGQEATLYIFESGLVVNEGYCNSTANLNCINPNPTDEDWDSFNPDRIVEYPYRGVREIYSVFYSSLEEYKQQLKKDGKRLQMQYEIMLHVPGLPGAVDGCYVNYTLDLTCTIRKLQRMIGKRKLKIKHVEGSAYAYKYANLVEHE